MKLTLKSIFGIIAVRKGVKLGASMPAPPVFFVKPRTIGKNAKGAKLGFSGVFFLLGNVHLLNFVAHIVKAAIEPVIRFYADVDMARSGLHLQYNNRTNLPFVKGFEEALLWR